MRTPALVLLVMVAFATPASAFEDFEGTRALGMGGATRAWALGESGLLLNPSGMSLAKAYNVEASYLYGSRAPGHFFHASVVDSTSASALAGGVYYTYHSTSPAGLPSGSGHETGAALSLPFGGYLALGTTLKWFRLEGADRGPAARGGGLTFDVGATVRPTDNVSLAVVGSNLRNLSAGQAPQGVSYGAAFIPVTDLVLAADGVTTFTRDDRTGRRGTGFRGGVEWSVAQRVALRAGGGFDPTNAVGFLSAGLAALSEIGAFDLGVRGDLFPRQGGGARDLFFGASFRLFVPAPSLTP